VSIICADDHNAGPIGPASRKANATVNLVSDFNRAMQSLFLFWPDNADTHLDRL